MLEHSILQIVRMFPRGTTDGQLLFRLGTGGLRNDPSAVLAALTALSQRGEIVRKGDRWLPDGMASPGKRPPPGPPVHCTDTTSALVAAPGLMEPAPRPDAGLGGADLAPSAVPWASALGYFASTQRRDPRGAVERYPDQHGKSWQLFAVKGRWWDGAAIVIRAGDLPDGFRETLARSGHRGTAALGWPVTVLRTAEGQTCSPGLLLPASWVLDDTALRVTAEAVPPVVNPAWAKEIRRRKGWREEVLIDTLFGGEEESSLDGIAPRLGHALASLGGASLQHSWLAREIALDGEGLRNAAALVLPDEARFTRRVAEDLDSIKSWGQHHRSATALSALLEAGEAPEGEPPPVVPPDALSDLQAAAAAAALSGPVTAIQGPPGTGKSQTIVALITTAVAAGQSVLFVARNHRALDEVEGRIGALFPDCPILVRGRDADGERDTSFLDALDAIIAGPTLDADTALAARADREWLLEAMRGAQHGRVVAAERDQINLALSELSDRIEAIRAVLPSGAAPRRPSLPVRLRMWLRARFARSAGTGKPLSDSATIREIEARMAELHRALPGLPASVAMADAPVAALRRIAGALVLPDAATQGLLRDRVRDLRFQRGGARISGLTPEDARLILRHRPAWAVSSLSVPARVPLIPGLFDLAIFDEASQADIASSLPVLARARRAVIVGDPQQLSFIPGLGREQEHALMDAAGLPQAGRALWAQSINSLFDFVAGRLDPARVHLLCDQFRSAPDIVDYTSRAFYGGRLVARRDDDAFSPPRDYRPGLHWEDVVGTAIREDGGTVNHAEADWIAARLARLVREEGLEGSVGVISPFNTQVGLIRRRVEATLTEGERAQLGLVIGTVDGWQGGEADVVFFSLVVGSGAPSSGLTFLSRERRRFNVAISRARAVAVVVGDLAWARASRIAHVADLADRATRPPVSPPRSFDSIWERRMFEALRRRGLDPKEQYPVGRRSLDFALFAEGVKLDLEVDGVQFHTGADGGRKTADRLRDRELIARGWKVRRFWVWELHKDMEGCLDIVERDLGRR